MWVISVPVRYLPFDFNGWARFRKFCGLRFPAAHRTVEAQLQQSKITTKQFKAHVHSSPSQNFHLHTSSHRTMNSIAMQLNNSAIDALDAGDLTRGFNILLKACADQSRLGKQEHCHRGHRKHGLNRKPGTKNQDHIFEYIFEDCSSLLALHNRGENVAVCPHNMLCLKFLRLGSPLTKRQLDSMCSCGVSWVLGYK